jgi:hypothetical protein
MNDQYRISETSAAPAEKHRDALRPALWIAMFVFAAANAVSSTATGNMAISSAFGAAALACAITLIVHHYRHRA